MKGFIDVTDIAGERRLINVRHIEEIAKDDEERCTIYMAYHPPHGIDQNYVIVDMSFDEIKETISKS